MKKSFLILFSITYNVATFTQKAIDFIHQVISIETLKNENHTKICIYRQLIRNLQFLFIVLILLSCGDENNILVESKYFIVDGVKVEIIEMFNYYDYNLKNGRKNFYSAIVLSDGDLSSESSSWWNEIITGDYGIDGKNILMIRCEIGYNETNIELEKSTQEMMKTFSANNVWIGRNYNSKSKSYVYFEKLKTISNDSFYDGNNYHIIFSGITYNNISVECNFEGKSGGMVLKM